MADLPIDLDRAKKTPLAAQIYRAIREAIETGRLASGAKLPSWRDLAAQLGVSRSTASAFDTYLISHDLPISEVLVSRRKDIMQEFTQGFDGMTAEPVLLEDLLVAREALITAMAGGMPVAHREFLLGFKRGALDWNLLAVQGAADLPAVRWKQINLEKLSADARTRLVDQLAKIFGGWASYIASMSVGSIAASKYPRPNEKLPHSVSASGPIFRVHTKESTLRVRGEPKIDF